MAAGASIVNSVPSVGTTVDTLSKLKDGLYSVNISVSGTDVPKRLELRASSLGSLNRRFGASYKFNPQVLDVAAAASKGRITITLNVDATQGSAVNDADMVTHVRHFFGALLKSTLLEGLRDGSLQ